MIVVDDIHRRYGKRQVLRGVSLEAAPGQIVAIAGRNGCGKTTLLQILAGSLKPDSGAISIFGHDALKDRRVFGRFTGFVPQDDPIFTELSVRDNLKFWAAGVKDPDESVIETLKLKDIMDDAAGTLSGGMRRRLSIACALQRKTPVLILDEPTSALDLYYQDSISSLLREYTDRNGIVIMSTHSMQELKVADRIYILRDGRATELEDPVDEELIRKELLVAEV